MKHLLATLLVLIASVAFSRAAHVDSSSFVAHRGLSSIAPENTLAAYALTWAEGIQFAEVDVHLTADGEVVCLHDSNLERTTGVDREISDMTWEEVRELDAGSWMSEEYAGEGIPLLRDVISQVPDWGTLLVEIKTRVPSVPAIVDVIRETECAGDVWVICFDKPTLERVVELMPEVKTLWLVSATKDPETEERLPIDPAKAAEAAAAGFAGIDVLYQGVHRDLVEACEAADIELHTWTIDDPAVAWEMLCWGVDSVTTNQPSMLYQEIQAMPEEEAQRIMLSTWTTEQKVGQLLMPVIPHEAVEDQSIADNCLRMVVELGVGCFTVRVRTAADTVRLVNEMQAASHYPLLISVNFERGTGHFWEEGTLFPRQMALAATGDPNTARTVGEYTAREALACGIHWALVPIADVNINPQNPIINIRSYGEDVETVGAFAAAFAEGCEGGGLLSCAKHFPGHGDTAADSHLELAVVESERSRLNAVELPPFQSAIDAGVGSVMTSHIWFPALMGDEGQIPATISEHVLTDLLRDEMGFGGLVVTDSMHMRGITNRLSPGEAAVEAVKAGADVILDSEDTFAAHAALVEAVRTGDISEERLDQSVRRILTAKSTHVLGHPTQVVVGEALEALQRPDAVEAARDIARRSITVVRNANDTLPLIPAQIDSALHIALYDEWKRWDPDELAALRDGLQDRLSNVETEVFLHDPDEEISAALGGTALTETSHRDVLERAANSDVIIVTAFVRTASYKGTVGLGAEQIALLEDLTETDKPVVLVVFGSPYFLTSIPEMPVEVLTYDTSGLFTSLIPGALCGEFPLAGRLPVTLPERAAYGHGIEVPAVTP